MSRMYTVNFENVAVGTATQDLFEITPADDKPIRLVALYLDNVGGAADAGEAQEEFIRLSIVRGHTTSGSGGTSPTPAPARPIDTAAGFTAEVNNTTIASTAGTTIMAFGMNVRAGLREVWPDELQPAASQANTTIVVRSLSTLADAIQMSGTLWVMEID